MQSDDIGKLLKDVAESSGDLQKLEQHREGEAQEEFGTDQGLNPLEKEIERIWKEMLDLPSIDPNADFFELGGDSIYAVQTLSELKVMTGVDDDLLSLLDQTISIRTLAAKLRERMLVEDK